ncbi:uncharacterized protein LOC120276846 [Dioscorea cayenensis subsp. rotundata]|uniref:Uncharacterized protein LOC120276846 n=1 Tax=Dioscorea cayennensis subsp. rotundata TaxID=55577 RepID=A0AB40CMS4_DIOCR|nr:uncharacterized protein LOC120276846 [Dioscorea cayenensis subsp. rotundata]
MASRSPSPTPSNKTPDTSIRKSGSFHNLSKHSISPDVHQRSSGSKAGTPSRSLRASLELKENERDQHSLRQGKVKSPAMASLKNFMAPTISASSKVVAASPRRRILGDRNEMVSVSVSDSPKSETRMMDLEIKKSSEDVVVPKFPISPVCDSLPPYDPLTNYLSPRPQFLRYNPNRRVEKCYLKKDVAFFDEPEGDGISDDSFLSDCFTDITEEMQSSDLQKSSQEEEEEEEEEEEVQGETKPQIVHIQTTRSTSRSKLVPFLLVLVMACLCIPLSDSPLVVSPSSVLKEGSLAKVEIREYLTDIAAFAKLNLEGLSDRMSHWSVNTMSYLATMPWLQKDSDFGVFHLPNISTTASDEDVAIDFFSFSETRPNQEHWNVELETEQFLIEDVEELEEEVEELENGGFLGPEPEVKEVEETDEVNESEMGLVAFHDVLENDHEVPTVEEVAKEDYTGVASVVEGKTEESPLSIHPVSGGLGIVENQEDIDELNSIVEILPVAGFDGKQSIKAAKEDSMAAASKMERKTEESLLGIHPVSDELGMVENQIDTHVLNSTVEMLPVAGFDGKHSTLKSKEIMNHGAKIFVAVIAVIGAIVVLYLNRRKSSADGNHGLDDKYDNVMQKFTEEVEMAGYSGSSDGSSLNNKTSYDQQRARGAKLEDSLGHERSLRRDSSALSSISYGSFTTYERLSAKKGAKDESAVTPVRRSSRIRNQVVSP